MRTIDGTLVRDRRQGTPLVMVICSSFSRHHLQKAPAPSACVSTWKTKIPRWIPNAFQVKPRSVLKADLNSHGFIVMNIGLERPIASEAGRNYHLQPIVDDTIGTLYVDGGHRTCACMKRPGESLSIFATDGVVEVRKCLHVGGLKEV